MVVEFRTRLRQAFAKEQQGSRLVELPILTYWGICAALGVTFLYDWMMQWNVGQTLSRPWLVAYLIITLIISQVIYFIVACDDGRPLQWGPTLLFTFGNGIFEAFAFGLVYRLGETVGTMAMGWIAPAATNAASIVGFVLGVLLFTIYGGLIHGLFWIKLLPPHFKSTPRTLLLRKYRPMAEVFLVTGWSLCFWLTRDIWTVVIIHIVLDFCMMLRVRPQLFQALNGKKAPEAA